MQSERIPQTTDPGFMLELAHYEWVELALDVSAIELPKVKLDGDLLADQPVISPLAWVLSYQYPVNRIGRDFQPSPEQADTTHIIVYRDRQMQVGFIEINPTTRRLLQILADEMITGRAALLKLAGELEHSNPDAMVEFGVELLTTLRSKDIICGFH